MTLKKRNAVSSRFVRVCIALSSLAILAYTCHKRTDSPVIARVGRAILTLDDLYERIPPEYSDRITREQKINYVKLWIDTELLYQEALRLNVHKEPEIRSRLTQMKKDLLSAEMISRNAVTASKNPISDDAVRAYYEEHKNEFVRGSDVIKYQEIVVGDQKTAWEVHRLITAENFLDLAVKYSTAPVQDPRTIPYVPVSSLPKNLAALIPTIKINGTTAPVEADGAFHIVRILDKQPAGSTCSLEEVREEIISSLSTDVQKRSMDELLSGLRLKMDYELHFDLIPGADGISAGIQSKG